MAKGQVLYLTPTQLDSVDLATRTTHVDQLAVNVDQLRLAKAMLAALPGIRQGMPNTLRHHSNRQLLLCDKLIYLSPGKMGFVLNVVDLDHRMN